MAHFGQVPLPPDESDSPRRTARRAKIGLLLFFIYLAFYVGYMLLNVLDPALMEKTFTGGVNLAILYGFALIVAALLLALVYAWLCREPAS
jgi:uncharacterized membrane protein (DUF485 family)